MAATALLIGYAGPASNSGACFAALLGTPEHGRWLIAPRDPDAQAARRYRDGTLILETDFETPDGAVTLIDFMPQRGDATISLASSSAGAGSSPCASNLCCASITARQCHGSPALDDGTLEAIAGPDMVLATDAHRIARRTI